MDEAPTYLFGLNGQVYIQSALSDRDPRQVIDEIQTQYGLADASSASQFQPVLKLLDLFGQSRAETYRFVLQKLLDELRQKIKTMKQDQLNSFLEMTFPYVSVEELSAVPLSLMERHENIPVHFLRSLAANPDVYKVLSLQVRRQVWQVDANLFKEHVFPLLNRYVKEAETTRSTVDLFGTPVHPKKRREQNAVLQEIVQDLGRSVTLFKTVLELVRSLFVSTENKAFCTLRSELVMSLHDLGVSLLYEADICHKFAWCIDACVRDDAMEQRQIVEMQSFFDSVQSDPSVLGDLAMIVNDPYVQNLLVRNILRTLQGTIERAEIPKDNEVLVYMTQMMALGLKARRMLVDKEFSFPKKEKDVLGTFYPLLGLTLLDIHTLIQSKATNLQLELPPTLSGVIKKSTISKKVFFVLLLTHLHSGNFVVAQQLLSVLKELPDQQILEEMSYVQSMIFELFQFKERSDQWRGPFIEDFLLNIALSSMDFHTEVLRLVVGIASLIPPKLLATYVQRLLLSFKNDGLSNKLDAEGPAASLYRSLLATGRLDAEVSRDVRALLPS